MFFFVMECAPGGTLQDRIKEQVTAARSRSYSPPEKACRWLGQVFLGMEHMHLKVKTMLRDLKPANVLLDENGVAKLSDFGFAGASTASAGTWSFQKPPSSPGYVAPELIAQKETNFSCDLYSFGVMVWVLYTGGRG